MKIKRAGDADVAGGCVDNVRDYHIDDKDEDTDGEDDAGGSCAPDKLKS